MPSHLHQFLVELVRERPRLVEHLLRKVLRVRLPPRIALRPGPTTVSEIMPAEHAADSVFEVCALDDDMPRLAVIFEVQLERDDDKEFTWPLYVAGQRVRLRCPALLVVMTPSRATARWAPVRDLDEATARLYSDVVFAYLARAARRKLEIEMGLENYEYQSEFAKKFIALGREEGHRAGEVEASRSLLRSVAAARGLVLTPEQVGRIDACDDVAVLQAWATRAATAASADEVF